MHETKAVVLQRLYDANPNSVIEQFWLPIAIKK